MTFGGGRADGRTDGRGRSNGNWQWRRNCLPGRLSGSPNKLRQRRRANFEYERDQTDSCGRVNTGPYPSFGQELREIPAGGVEWLDKRTIQK